jgi:hypothetical protein
MDAILDMGLIHCSKAVNNGSYFWCETMTRKMQVLGLDSYVVVVLRDMGLVVVVYMITV